MPACDSPAGNVTTDTVAPGPDNDIVPAGTASLVKSHQFCGPAADRTAAYGRT